MGRDVPRLRAPGPIWGLFSRRTKSNDFGITSPKMLLIDSDLTAVSADQKRHCSLYTKGSRLPPNETYNSGHRCDEAIITIRKSFMAYGLSSKCSNMAICQ